MEEEIELVPNELDVLKQRADMMGIKYHPNTGVDKLKAKINNAIDSSEENTDVIKLSTGKAEYLDYEAYKKLEKSQRIKEASKLVRVRITCMNPNKSSWEGEVFSIGSAKLGTFKKYIPFNSDEGWHIPKIMYDYLKERKCSVFHTVKGLHGEKIRKSKLVPEFSIEMMSPLTKEELKDLARRQAMAKGGAD